jgi:hypothetical protein
VPRAELRLLQCKAQAQPFPEKGLDTIREMADDNRRGLRIERVSGPKDALDEREARRLVENLRDPRLHACSLAGGKHDEMDFWHRPGRRRPALG